MAGKLATLYKPGTDPVQVESGSQQAQQYFGKGYTLQNPNTPAPGVVNPPPTSFVNTPDDVFGKAMNEMRTKLSTNNDLMQQKAKLLNQIYNRPLTPDEMKTLTPSQQNAVQSNNRNLIDTEVRLVNDSIQGRNDTLDKSISYVTDLYTQQQKQQQDNLQQAQGNILEFIQQYGSNAPAAIKSLYGPDMIKKLKDMGLDVEKMASLSTLGETKSSLQYGQGGTTTFSENDPPRLINNNNPTAFTTDIAKQAGLVEGVDYIQGDPFKMSSGQTLYTAKLLGDPIEITKRAIDRIGFYTSSGQPRWSYVKQLPQNIINNWKNATDDEKNQVIQKMYAYEGGKGQLIGATVDPYPPDQSIANTVNPSLGVTPNAVYNDAILYALTGKTPSLGLGSATQTKNTRFAIQNKAGAMVDAAGTDLATLQADYKANATSLNKIVPTYNQLVINENNAIKNFSLLASLADKVDQNTFQTSVPLINEWLRSGQVKLTGNADVNNFMSTLVTTMTEYAKVVTGQTTGQAVTDSARQEMSSLLNTGLNANTIRSFAGVAQQDMDNRKTSFEEQISGISGNIANFLKAIQPSGLNMTGNQTGNSQTAQQATTTSDKTFQDDLKGAASVIVTSRSPKQGEMTREQVIQRLVQEYPQIPLKQLQDAVYKAYPDNYR